MGYIYKITNTITNKCYIGETKESNPETRWKKHKNTIKNGVGCPALRDAVKKYGIEFFKFEILIICFDEDRYKYEIEYIKKYNSKVPNGYNILDGGPGGSFQGKKHSEETKKRISEKLKQKYINNPLLKKEISERNKILLNSQIIKSKIKEGILNSKIYKQTIKKKKFHTEETKNKIKESVKKYYNESNIIERRKLISKSVGIKVFQYDLNYVIINTYASFAEASRQSGIPNSTIKKCVKNNTNNRGFFWKKENIYTSEDLK